MDIERLSDQNITAAINYEALCRITQKEGSLILSLLDQMGARFSLYDPLIIHLEDYQEVFDVPSSALIDAFLSIKKGFLALKTNEYVLSYKDSLYPPYLKDIPFLYLRGDISLLSQPLMYVTGTRFIHPKGKERTKDLISLLCDQGKTLVTGLDRGIESIASLTALAKKGKVVAFLSTTLDSYRYDELTTLQDYLGEHGLVVSPFSPVQESKRWHIAVQKEILCSVSDSMVIPQEKDGGFSIKSAALLNQHGKSVYIYEDSLYDRSQLWPRNLSKMDNVVVVKNNTTLIAHLEKLGAIQSDSHSIEESPQLSLFD